MIYDGVEFLIYYVNIYVYKYVEFVMNGKNKYGLILS